LLIKNFALFGVDLNDRKNRSYVYDKCMGILMGASIEKGGAQLKGLLITLSLLTEPLMADLMRLGGCHP
jgi:hypothetical protein